MTLPAFLAVWLATWALCWWPLARVWPTSRFIWVPPDAPLIEWARGKWCLREFRYLDGHSVKFVSAVRDRAPHVATAVAFAVDVLVGFVA